LVFGLTVAVAVMGRNRGGDPHAGEGLSFADDDAAFSFGSHGSRGHGA